MTQWPTTLEIMNIRDDLIRFEIKDPSNLSALQEVWKVEIQPEVLQMYCEKIKEAVIDSLTHTQLRGTTKDSILEAGKTLYDLIIHEYIPGSRQDLRKILKDIKKPLLISTDNPKIFWELMHDGEDYFAFKYSISRQVKRRGVPRPTPKKEKEFRCLIIADPTDDLKDTFEETTKLKDWLSARGVDCDYLARDKATLKSIIDKLPSGYDIIHYAGHIEEIEVSLGKKEYALKLSKNPKEMLWARIIRQCVKGAPIVFLNGCWSADRVKSLSDTFDSVDSITDAFLEAGAQLVIGSLFPVPDDGARIFAEKFYQSVLDGNIVGEALRTARLHIKNNPNLGCSWACFVMYGDPCLQIKVDIDEIEKLLNKIELSKKNFEIPASRIIEQAIMYGKPNARVSTSNLFAAMIVERGKELEDIFHSHNIKFEEIKGAFEKFFTTAQPRTNETVIKEIALSKNVEAILKCAKEIAKNDKRDKISDKDISNAFLKAIGRPDGEPKDIYLKLPRPQPPKDILKKSECHPSAWEVLTSATEAADQTGSGIITTAHFFIGLLSCPSFFLYRALRQHGISPIKFFNTLSEPFEKESKEKKTDASVSSIKYSENVKRILAIAKEINQKTNGNLLTDRELLSAFVQCGGGSTGKMLAEFGIDLSIIFFDLFSDEGLLIIEKFDDICIDILEKAKDYAVNLDTGFVSSLHLFYGICSSSSSHLGNKILNLGISLGQLDDVIKKIISHREIDIPINLALPFMALGFRQALFMSVNICRKQNSEKITEKHLLEALLTPKKSSVREVLKKLEINPDILMENLI